MAQASKHSLHTPESQWHALLKCGMQHHILGGWQVAHPRIGVRQGEGAHKHIGPPWLVCTLLECVIFIGVQQLAQSLEDVKMMYSSLFPYQYIAAVYPPMC